MKPGWHRRAWQRCAMHAPFLPLTCKSRHSPLHLTSINNNSHPKLTTLRERLLSSYTGNLRIKSAETDSCYVLYRAWLSVTCLFTRFCETLRCRRKDDLWNSRSTLSCSKVLLVVLLKSGLYNSFNYWFMLLLVLVVLFALEVVSMSLEWCFPLVHFGDIYRMRLSSTNR